MKAQTSEQVANLSFTGQLGEYGIRTPWAEDGLGVNTGVEYRNESFELVPDQAFQSGDLNGQAGATLPTIGDFRVLEWFAEAQFPIVQNGFVDDLSLNVGYRKSFYRTSAGRKYDTDTFKIGVEFAPIRDVRFRGAYNRAVRAPNIQELFDPIAVGLSGSNDPCAGHVIQANEYGCIATGLAVGQRTAE